MVWMDRKNLLWGLGATVGAVVLVAVVLVTAYAGNRQAAPESVPREALLPVATTSLEWVESFPVTTRFTGQVRAARAVTLAFEPAGRVAQLTAEEGEAVSEGQVLAVLDKRRLEARQAELAGEIAATESALDHARREERRQQDLHADGASTQRELDAARSERRQLEGQLRSLNARGDAVAADLDDATLIAPFDGVVAERMIDKGSFVSASTPAFRLIDPASLEAVIGVPARHADRLHPGDTVTLHVGDQQLEGDVLRRVPEIGRQGRTLSVRVDLSAHAGRIFPGQVTHMEYAHALPEEGFVVPEEALLGAGAGLWAVLVAEPVEDGVAVVRQADVQWLYSHNGQALLRGGLESGTRVVAEGVHRLVPGQKVRLPEDGRP